MSEQKSVNTTLRSIYEEEGSSPDMSKLDQKHDGRWGKTFAYFIGVVLLGTLVAWLGFRLFIPSNPGDVVAVTIDALEQVTAGSKMTVTFHYENNDHSPLALAVLKTRYPKEFVPESSTPRSDDDTLTNWTLGTIDRGMQGSIAVQGRVMGTIGTNAQIQSTLTYKPASFNAEFTSLANRSFGIIPAVEMSFDGPHDVRAGQTITFTARYKNISDTSITNAQLRFAPGPAFSVTKSSKAPLKENTWAIKTLDPDAVGELTITGVVTSAASMDTSLPFGVITQFKREDIALGEAFYPLTVTQGELGIAIERDADAPVRLGDTVSGRIVVTNSAPVPLGDVTVQLSSPSSLDWSAASSSVAIASTKGGLTWSPSAALLKAIASGERVTIPFTIKTPSAGSSNASTLVLSASAKAAKRDGKAEPLTAKSADLSIALGSNINADAYAVFYDDAGVPVGSGPLPPRVGEETKYRVIWKIKNGTRDLVDVSLAAQLPENVTFAAKHGVGAGALSYDEATRTMRWSLSRLPSSVPEVIAQFDVMLVPVTNDQGQAAVLMEEATLTATDASITDPIVVTLGRLTTDLSRDQKAGGRGAVLP